MCIVERYLSFSLRSGILAGCAALRASWLILVSRLGRRTVSLPQRYRRAKHTARALQFRRATPALASNGRATSDRGSTPLHDAGEPADRLVPPQQLHDLEQIRRARAASIYQYSVQRDGTKLIGNFSNALLITASARTMSGAPSRRFAQPTATD